MWKIWGRSLWIEPILVFGFEAIAVREYVLVRARVGGEELLLDDTPARLIDDSTVAKSVRVSCTSPPERLAALPYVTSITACTVIVSISSSPIANPPAPVLMSNSNHGVDG